MHFMEILIYSDTAEKMYNGTEKILYTVMLIQ